MHVKKVFESMVYTRKNDEAVSPVIGVILMVAITVILAAVIAAFVFGMSGNISKTKTVALTAQKIDSGNITIMNNGGQDAGTLVKIDTTTSPNPVTGCYLSTAPATNKALVNGACEIALVDFAAGTTAVPVGSNMRVTGGAAMYAAKTGVVSVGTFNDGSTQVLLDTAL